MITFESLTTLPDGKVLVHVVETERVRRWWGGTVERSRVVGYVHHAGAWWGEHNQRVTDPYKIVQLCEMVAQSDVVESLDAAIA